MGTFGPCAPGSIHYKRPCPLCNGSCKIPMGFSVSPCAVCKSMGGLGTFGPCEVGSVHYKSMCQQCQGKGYALIPAGYSTYPGSPPPSSSPYYPPQPSYPASYPAPAPTPYYPPQPSYQASYPAPGPSHSFINVNSSRSAPVYAVHGHQNDGAGQVSCAIAHTAQGDIPGKAKDGNCWYAYGGKEISTTNFSWLVISRGSHMEQNRGRPPSNAVAAGFQNDGAGTVYAAIAQTPQGNIPGKAKDNTCWYPYGGKEQSTSNFMWVCFN